MRVVLVFLLLYLISHIYAGKNTRATNEDHECYGEIEKAQHKLDALIKHLEEASRGAKFPNQNGPDIEKIKMIKKLIRKLKKLSKQEIKTLDEVILSNLEKNMNATSTLEKIEKRIHEYKVKTLHNRKTLIQLETILELIRSLDMNLTIHFNTYEICKEAEGVYKTFTDDVNIVSKMYQDLNNVFKQHWQHYEDLVADVAHVEALLDDIKIPQSYISNYLCRKENQLQKKIDETFLVLDNNTDLLGKIIAVNKKPEEITAISDMVQHLNKDFIVVYDVLKAYEQQIPEKASIEKIEESDISDITELQNNVKDLDESVTKILSSLKITNKNIFLDEYERKLSVLNFILSDENLAAVENEIDKLENYNLRIQKLINEKTILEVEIEDIEKLVKQMTNQRVCRGTGSED